MANEKPAENEAPTDFPMTVAEFCQQLSQKDKRPELIYAFSKDEAAKGHVKDRAVVFQIRFESFAGRPA